MSRIFQDEMNASAARKKAAAAKQPRTGTRSSRFMDLNTRLPNSPNDRQSISGSTLAVLEDIENRRNQPPTYQPYPTQTYGGGSYRSGGGGGGGYSAPKVDYGGQVDFLTQLLGSGAFDPKTLDYQDRSKRRVYERDNAIYDRVATGVQADRGNATSAYDQLDKFLAQIGPNPYAQAQGRTAAPQVDQSLLALLGSQGVDPSAYQAEASFMQQQGAQGAGVFDDLLGVLAANYTSGRQSRQAEAGQARAFTDRELSSQKLGMDTALDLREQARRRQIEDYNSGLDQSEVARQRQVQDANVQLAIQAEQAKMQLIQQLSTLAAQGNIDQPTLEALGLK